MNAVGNFLAATLGKPLRVGELVVLEAWPGGPLLPAPLEGCSARRPYRGEAPTHKVVAVDPTRVMPLPRLNRAPGRN